MDCGCAQVQLGRDWADAMFSDPCTPEKAQQCCLTKFHHINFERFLKKCYDTNSYLKYLISQ